MASDDLRDDDWCDLLRDWWDEETTVGVESAFPLIARLRQQWEREAAARAWDEGYRLGADLGLRIGERIVGTRDEWPAVQANPYRPDPTEGEESCS